MGPLSVLHLRGSAIYADVTKRRKKKRGKKEAALDYVNQDIINLYSVWECRPNRFQICHVSLPWDWPFTEAGTRRRKQAAAVAFCKDILKST